MRWPARCGSEEVDDADSIMEAIPESVHDPPRGMFLLLDLKLDITKAIRVDIVALSLWGLTQEFIVQKGDRLYLVNLIIAESGSKRLSITPRNGIGFGALSEVPTRGRQEPSTTCRRDRSIELTPSPRPNPVEFMQSI